MARAQVPPGEPADGRPMAGFTLAYRSPEQTAGLDRPGIGTDVWSWAVTVFEMFAGHPPGPDGSQAGTAFAEFVGQGAHSPELPRMPPAVIDLLNRCLTPDAAGRPPFGALANELVEIYGQLVGRYPRQPPVAATLLADGLSNHALSMLDLGHPDRADESWRRAIAADPHHPQARFNRGLYRWRTAAITDTDLIEELETVREAHRNEPLVAYLLALVHRERGDRDRAIALLREAFQHAPEDPEVSAALADAEQAPATPPPVVLSGHPERITAVGLSPDGHLAVTVHDDGTLSVWDVPTEANRLTVRVGQDDLGLLEITPDGRSAIVARWYAATVVDLATGAARELAGYRDLIRCLACSENGESLVTHGDRGQIITWNLATGQAARVVDTGRSGAQALGGHGRVCAYVDYDQSRVHLHDLDTNQPLHTLAGWHTWACLSADGRIAVATGGNPSAGVYDVVSGEQIGVADVGYGAVAVSADGSAMFSAGSPLSTPTPTTLTTSPSNQRPARLWQLPACRCRLTLGPEAAGGKSPVLSHDGRVVATADGHVLTVRQLPPAGPPAPWSYVRPRPVSEVSAAADRVADALARATRLAERGLLQDAAQEIRQARDLPGHRREASLVRLWRQLGRYGVRTSLRDGWPAGQIAPERNRSWAFAFNGRSRAVVARNGNDRDVWVFDVETGRLLHTMSLHSGTVNDVALSEDGELAVSGGDDGRIAAWRPREGRLVRRFDGARVPIWAVAVSADGRVALAGDRDGNVLAWDIDASRLIGGWPGHAGGIMSIDVSADRRYGISLGQDERVGVWDLRKARPLHVLQGHGWIGSARLSPTGALVITAGADATLRAWQTRNGKPVSVLRGHTDAVVRSLTSPDDTKVLSGSEDGTVRLWDLRSGRCRYVLDGHAGAVLSLAATPDFELAVSGGEDRMVRLWDLRNGSCLRTFEGHTDNVDDVAMVDDGTLVLSGSSSGHFRIWALDWEYDFTRSRSRIAVPLGGDLRELREDVAVALTTRTDRAPN